MDIIQPGQFSQTFRLDIPSGKFFPDIPPCEKFPPLDIPLEYSLQNAS